MESTSSGTARRRNTSSPASSSWLPSRSTHSRAAASKRPGAERRAAHWSGRRRMRRAPGLEVTERLRWGLLSTARINAAILNGAHESDSAEVIAVASRDRDRAVAYAAEHGIERAYGSYPALLGDPDVDAVYISLPNSLHLEWTMWALDAGKHVLCEKPLGRRPDEVERAFEAAARNDRLLMEAFMYRHHLQTYSLKELVSSRRIGELRHVHSVFSFTLDNVEDVRMQPELDGGALMDVGCYCVNALRLLAGEPDLVIGRQIVGPTGVDIRFVGVLEFAGGVTAGVRFRFDLPYEGAPEAI